MMQGLTLHTCVTQSARAVGTGFLLTLVLRSN